MRGAYGRRKSRATCHAANVLQRQRQRRREVCISCQFRLAHRYVPQVSDYGRPLTATITGKERASVDTVKRLTHRMSSVTNGNIVLVVPTFMRVVAPTTCRPCTTTRIKKGGGQAQPQRCDGWVFLRCERYDGYDGRRRSCSLSRSRYVATASVLLARDVCHCRDDGMCRREIESGCCCSCSRPSTIAMRRSADAIVSGRCAMMMRVRPSLRMARVDPSPRCPCRDATCLRP